MNARDSAASVVRTLREAGFEALFAGGCVRDLLLGVEPDDYDVATDAPPERIEALFDRTSAVGAAFGVILVRIGAFDVEVATFRADGPYLDGRHPENVRFPTEPREDAARRDFTINALFLEPDSGTIHDFVGGRDDLDAKVVRAVGDPAARFKEDRLRMLRAVRFAARLGFDLDPATADAIRANAAGIGDVSPERIREELDRILTEGAAERGFILLRETGLLTEVLPEIAATEGVEQPPEYHPEGDVWTHTLLVLRGVDALAERTAALAWGALLHDIGKPPTFERADRIRFNGHARVGAEMADAIAERLKFSRERREAVVDLVASHMTFADVQQMRESRLRRFLGHPNADARLTLHEIDCGASHRIAENAVFCHAKLAGFADEPVVPPRLLTGHHLMEAGYEAGPGFSSMLEAAHDAQMEGAVTTLEEALSFVRDRFGPPD